MTRFGVVASSKRRLVAGPVGPPITDTFDGPSIDAAKWTTLAGSPSIVAGRLRAAPPGGEADTSAVFDLTKYRVWIQIPTLPIAGAGTIKTRFWLGDSDYTNIIQYDIEGNPRILWSQGSGITAATVATYSATAHQWLGLRISGGNLLFEGSADGKTFTTLRSVTAPTWLATHPVRVMLGAFQTGATEASPGFAEYDNFNITPA